MKNKNADSPTLQHGLLLVLTIIIMSLSLPVNAAAQAKVPLVHIAKITVDPAQLESYRAALKENAEASIRSEPGVLTLYGVSDKADATRITVFEIYADTAAYRSHLRSAHFKKYKATVKDMVKSLELVDVVPIALESKRKL